ncbi:hypothetical protein HUJ05_009117 [Dendroctonus ponderosae]|nr:hypothetical protein HUJ05_009117 [Dendroctonus ponderosae]
MYTNFSVVYSGCARFPFEPASSRKARNPVTQMLGRRERLPANCDPVIDPQDDASIRGFPNDGRTWISTRPSYMRLVGRGQDALHSAALLAHITAVLTKTPDRPRKATKELPVATRGVHIFQGLKRKPFHRT